MMRLVVFPLAVLTTVAGLTWLAVGAGKSEGQTGATGALDVVQGETLYVEYCASCHGANLEGQADWRSPGPDGRLPAPPHDETGHTWHHDDQLLFDYTKLGGAALMAQRGVEFDSGMLGFAEQLTDAEIHNVLAYIKSTWPDRMQGIQAERSSAETQ